MIVFPITKVTTLSAKEYNLTQDGELCKINPVHDQTEFASNGANVAHIHNPGPGITKYNFGVEFQDENGNNLEDEITINPGETHTVIALGRFPTVIK